MFYLNALSRFRVYASFLLVASILVLSQISLAANPSSNVIVRASTISGVVYDQNNNPLPRVDVELLNAAIGGSTSLRTWTDDVGRYQFTNIPDGRYTIKVLPFRFNLQDQSAEVVVQTVSFSGSGSGFFTQDFHLAAKKGGLGDTATGVIFAQEVPKEAEKLYKQAEKDLSDKKTSDGMKKLLAAIKVFPSYYAASLRLGVELLRTKQYMESARLFMRAVEVNPKSSRAFYYMGFALNKLGKKFNKSALKALARASTLASTSWEVAYLIGKIERQEGNYTSAEKHLLRSKKLADFRVPDIHIELAQLYGNDLKQYGKAADELELYMKASKKKDDKIKKKIVDLRSKAKKT